MTQPTLVLVLLGFIALVGLAILALLLTLVRAVMKMEQRVTDGLDQVRAEVVATAEQVRTTTRQVGTVMAEVGRGARYATMVVEIWRLLRGGRTSAPVVRSALWKRVGVPLGLMAARAVAARIKSGPPRTPGASG